MSIARLLVICRVDLWNSLNNFEKVDEFFCARIKNAIPIQERRIHAQNSCDSGACVFRHRSRKFVFVSAAATDVPRYLVSAGNVRMPVIFVTTKVRWISPGYKITDRFSRRFIKSSKRLFPLKYGG